MVRGARVHAQQHYLLTGAQHTLRAGIVRVDRELFHQIIATYCPTLKQLRAINSTTNGVSHNSFETVFIELHVIDTHVSLS